MSIIDMMDERIRARKVDSFRAWLQDATHYHWHKDFNGALEEARSVGRRLGYVFIHDQQRLSEDTERVMLSTTPNGGEFLSIVLFHEEGKWRLYDIE